MITSPSDSFPVLHASQLSDTVEEKRWLIDSLLGQAVVGVIGGPPKSNKTWIALELAVAVGSGTNALGLFKVHEPGPALVYLAEDGLLMVKERLSHLAKARSLPLRDVDVRVITAPSLRLDIESERVRLANTVSIHRPKILLLDPFVRLHRIDENQAQEVAPLLDFLRQLQRSFNTTVIVVHHVRKSGALKPGQALRGSGDFHAWGDSNLYLQPQQDGVLLTVEQRSARAIDPLFLRLLDNPLRLQVVNPPETRSLSLEERVIHTLTHSSSPISRISLRETLKVNNLKLGLALANLEQMGSIIRSRDGWSLRTAAASSSSSSAKADRPPARKMSDGSLPFDAQKGRQLPLPQFSGPASVDS